MAATLPGRLIKTVLRRNRIRSEHRVARLSPIDAGAQGSTWTSDPAQVMSILRGTLENMFAPVPGGLNLESADSLWAAEFEPLSHVPPNAYDGLMAPPTWSAFQVALGAPCPLKAPGPRRRQNKSVGPCRRKWSPTAGLGTNAIKR
jgi:hypothetical protein